MSDISFNDLWRLVDGAFDLISPELNRHHQMVSYLSYHVAQAAGLSPAMQHITLQAAYLHDVGSIIGGQNISVEDFEAAGYHAAQISSNLLADFPAFVALATVIRHCQSPYHKNSQLNLPALKLPVWARAALSGDPSRPAGKLSAPRLTSPLTAANIIHLADAVSLLIDPEKPVLNQVPAVMDAVRAASGQEYAPQAVQALERVAGEERIWFDLSYRPAHFMDEVLVERSVGLDDAMQIAKLVAMIIDFRSPFTAMHSAGVAASARELARLAGMNDTECQMMEIAGNLHDLGKIRTPREILEKPGKLTPEEFNVIKEHAYFTDMLLSRVRGLETIGKWAALHHEKINGSGYPYHLTGDQIPLGAKIMAVADVFSAITEDRPYRGGMPADRVRQILRENAGRGDLQPGLVELLIAHYDQVNDVRKASSAEAGRRYYRSMHP